VKTPTASSTHNQTRAIKNAMPIASRYFLLTFLAILAFIKNHYKANSSSAMRQAALSDIPKDNDSLMMIRFYQWTTGYFLSYSL
jgi:hypothetical protein